MTNIDMIRRHVMERDWRIINYGGRELLVNNATDDPEQHVIAEIVGPYSEQIQAVINEDVPALLAEIDRLNEALRGAETIIAHWPATTP